MTSLLNELFNPVPALSGATKFQSVWEWGRGIGPLTGVYSPVEDAMVEAEPDWWAWRSFMVPDDPRMNMALAWLGKYAPNWGTCWNCHIRTEVAMTHQRAIANDLGDGDERTAA